MPSPTRLFLLAFFLLPSLCGCGGGAGNVSGSVEYNGKPVKVGEVNFYGADGVPHGAKVDSDGKYAIKGVPTGKCKVVVIALNPKNLPSGIRDGKRIGPDEADVKNWQALPKKYEDLATSGLEFDVKSGDNTIPISLK